MADGSKDEKEENGSKRSELRVEDDNKEEEEKQENKAEKERRNGTVGSELLIRDLIIFLKLVIYST
jgi:hypothetical protein